MYKFDHPNVLKVLGVCMDGGPAPYIIMPFMANGSLNVYLRNERDNLLLDPASTKSDDAVSNNSEKSINIAVCVFTVFCGKEVARHVHSGCQGNGVSH
jgi:serine/threonine protein kinase